MTDDRIPTTAVRLPRDLVERATRLGPSLRANPHAGALTRVSSSAAVRLLLLDGIENAEAKRLQEGAGDAERVTLSDRR